MAENLVDIPFPSKGLNVGLPYRHQPEGTSPDLLNVRPVDIAEDRVRGGQRPGTEKYISQQIEGDNPIQAMHQVVSAINPTDIVPDELLFEDEFDYSAGAIETVSSGVWEEYSGGGAGGVSAFFRDGIGIGPAIAADGSGSAGLFVDQGDSEQAVYTPSVTPGTRYVIEADVAMEREAGATHRLHVFFRLHSDPVANHQYYYVELVSDSDVDDFVHVRVGKSTAYGAGSDVSADQATTATFVTQQWAGHLKVAISADAVSVWVDGTKYVDGADLSGDYNDQSGFGLGVVNNTSFADVTNVFNNYQVYTADAPAVLRRNDLIAVGAGSIWSGDKDGMSEASNGDSAMAASGVVSIESLNGKAYLCDGTPNNYKTWDPSSDAVTAWEATAGTLPTGSDETSYSIDAITLPSTITISEDLTSLVDGDRVTISGSTHNDGTYTVASTNGTTNIVIDQTLASDQDLFGLVQEQSKSCKFMTVYRSRMVLWGLQTDQQNWYMSAAGDALDWDYNPATTTQTQAVAGNNADAGKLGDILNCCAPYSDDLMIMGGDHTLWVMRGDPAAGGVIDNISYQTGIVGPYAYTWDPDGVIYFMGAGQIWRMTGAMATPESLTRSRMDSIFRAINTDANWCRMIWDRRLDGMHVFFTPINQPETAPLHYYWDRRTDSWWKQQYPIIQGPTAVATFDGDSADDRALLMGGFDGYIRSTAYEGKADDGTVINSYISFNPIVGGGDMVNSAVSRTTVILTDDSDAVRFEIHAGETAEKVATGSELAASKTLAAGRNAPLIQRVGGNSLMFRMENDSASEKSWAVESIAALIRITGRQRHGRL